MEPRPTPPPRLVLASASPARRTLLRAAGFDPEVIPSHVDEDGIDGLAPTDAVRTLAERKANAVAEKLEPDTAIVVGCDSMFFVAGELRGKAASPEQARTWWRNQRGQTGTLVTGHAVVLVGEQRRQVSDIAVTVVHFGSPTDAEIDAYVATGEPLAVAGGATIDGFGAPFVAGIEGDHTNVLGLSLPLLRDLLAQLDIAITDLWVTDDGAAP